MIFKSKKVTPHYTHTNRKGVLYHLNKKTVNLMQGRKQTIYYFTTDIRDTATEMPEGYRVNENPQNGFLYLSRDE